MNSMLSRVVRIITYVAIALSILLWIFTVYLWFMTEPGPEPINVLVSAILTSLVAFLGWLRSHSEMSGKETTKETAIVSFPSKEEIKHIIKDVPKTRYPPYHDGRRIKPSSYDPVYEFKLQDIESPQGFLLRKFLVSYGWQYHADSDYDPAVVRFSVIYPATVNTSERTETSSKTYLGPLKQWQGESLEINVLQGASPEALRIYVLQSGDFEFMMKDMQVKALFEK